MTQIAPPSVTPSQSQTESASYRGNAGNSANAAHASAGGADGQHFEDFLDAKQESAGKQASGNPLPRSQSQAPAKTRQNAASASVPDTTSAMASMMTAATPQPQLPPLPKVTPKLEDPGLPGTPAPQQAVSLFNSGLVATPILSTTPIQPGAAPAPPASTQSAASPAPALPAPLPSQAPGASGQPAAVQPQPVVAATVAVAPSANPGLLASAQAAFTQTPGIGKRSAEFAAGNQSAGTKRARSAVSQNSASGESDLNEEAAPLGTAIARQSRAMAIQAQLQESGASLRVNAPLSVEPEHTPAGPRLPAPANALPANQERDSARPAPSIPSTPASQSNPSAAPTPAPSFSISSSATLSQNTPAASAPAQQLANTTLRQVFDTADQMRSDGKTHVEVQLKLDDGQQLTVRLQMSQGALQPVFKTESSELRQAIEQNWSGFRSSASERGLEISTPVFESPSGGGAFNSFGNRDQSHQPGGDPSDAEGAGTLPLPVLRSGGTPTVSQPPAASSLVGSGVQMYA